MRNPKDELFTIDIDTLEHVSGGFSLYKTANNLKSYDPAAANAAGNAARDAVGSSGTYQLGAGAAQVFDLVQGIRGKTPTWNASQAAAVVPTLAYMGGYAKNAVGQVMGAVE